MKNLSTYLHQFVRQATAQASQLESELKQVEARKFDIEQKLKAAHLARDRANRFVPASGLDIYCRKCWILDERQARVRPYNSGEQTRTDHFECEVCRYDYEA